MLVSEPGGTWRRPVPKAEIDPGSGVLVRVGSACPHRCAFCTNVKGGANLDLSEAEVVRRVSWVRDLGFGRVVFTGGEPLALPTFPAAVETAVRRGMIWDVLTNARPAADPAVVERLRPHPPRLVIASFHSPVPAVASAIAGGVDGVAEAGAAGIENLLAADIPVMIHCVIQRLNLGHLQDLLSFSVERFGSRIPVLFSFPLLDVRDPTWEPLALRLTEAGRAAHMLSYLGEMLGVPLFFESFPACVIGREIHVLDRSELGTTHHLDDASGVNVVSEAWAHGHNYVYGERCLRCRVFARCSGVHRKYAARWGFGELRPL